MDNNTSRKEIEESKIRVKAWLDAAIEEDMLSNAHPTQGRGPLVAFLAGFSVAAALVAAVLLPRSITRPAAPQTISWTEIVANYGEKKSVTLPDGSVLWLHNDSRLLYPNHFSGDSRQVFASGEVFAKVTPDKAHPFVLSADGVNVVVKGTTFNLRAYPGASSSELTLLEGSVRLEMGGEGTPVQTIDVAAGEIVKADYQDGKISHFRFNPEKYVSWVDTRALYFNDETLEKIIAELERQFGIQVEVRSSALLKTRYYVSFVNGEDPLQIFNALNTTGIMRITRKDNTYIIYPNN